MQLPPGSPDSLSRSSSLDGALPWWWGMGWGEGWSCWCGLCCLLACWLVPSRLVSSATVLSSIRSWLMRPPASPLPSLPADCASLPSSRAVSVRRFPTLDSWGSALDAAATGANGGPGMAGKLPPGVQRVDSLAALAAQRFTNTFVAPPPEAAGDAPAAAAHGRSLRKRQHSSRRTLIAALSRDNSVASSLDGMQPTGKARHLCDADSCATSPAQDHAGSLQHMGSLGLPPPPPLGRPLHRTGSVLGREAAAQVAASMAEAAARAMAAVLPADMQSPAGTPTAAAAAAQPGAFFHDGGRGPPSPLHARMTCMKLRDTD